ncbi:MAG: hypothetical protein LKJ45_00025 [Oscillospiraceae bacterium]|jgi:hypothetical protein|nr:hypothetical protein [Oscillospiraceae bacterium]
MTNIFLCGDPEDATISKALIPALSLYGGVRYFAPEKTFERGVSTEFFLYECKKVPQIFLPSGIILIKNSIRPQPPVQLHSGFFCVFETQNCHAVEMLKDCDATIITCGTGAKETISIAALERSSATLSLQRNLVTMDQKTLEPHDFAVRFSQPRSPYQILFVSAALLIAGIDSSNGYII